MTLLPPPKHNALTIGPKHALGWLCLLSAIVLLASGRYLISSGAPYGDDNSSHLALMLHIARLLRAGETDFFWGQANLGVPLFLSYQPLPGLLMGALCALTSSWLPPTLLFKGSIVALWSLMPISWYRGARWLGFDRVQALALATLCLGIQDPHHYGLTLQSVAYKGLYTQSFGMLLLPLTVGRFYRAIHHDTHLSIAPGCWLALTFLSHIFFGLYAGIASALMLLTLRRHPKRLLWFGLQTIVAFALIAPWALPLLRHKHLVGGLPWKTILQQGWPLTQTLTLALQGSLFDAGRSLPWLTLLVATGATILLCNPRQPLHRWLLALALVTFFFFLGRTNLGALYAWIPLHGELNVMRYISGLHFCGLLCAAIALGTLLKALHSLLSQRLSYQHATRLSTLLLLLLSSAYLAQRVVVFSTSLKTFETKGAFHTLTTTLAKQPHHRILLHKRLRTSAHFYRDLLPALAKRPALQSFGMTFHATLGTYYTEYFDFYKHTYRLYNVRTLVARTPQPNIPRAPITPGQRIPPFTLFHAKEPFGAFEFVRAPFAIIGKPKAIRKTVRRILPHAYPYQLLPRLYFTPPRNLPHHRIVVQGPHHTRTFLHKQPSPLSHKAFVRALRRHVQPLRSRVLSEHSRLNRFEAIVQVHDPRDLLLLKVNAFPYWHASSAGQPLPLLTLAPNYMAVSLPPGKHHVRFIYKNPLPQKIGLLLSFVFLAVYVLYGFVRRRRERHKVLASDSPNR